MWTESQPERPAHKGQASLSVLSERWHRVAIQQAAGIAQSRHTNRAEVYQDYLDDLLTYQEQQQEAKQQSDEQQLQQFKELEWHEWNIPTLKQICIQANANVVILEPSKDSSFDYWLKISTLEFRKQLLVPHSQG